MRVTLSTILISGTSHVGKTTLAKQLSAKLRCETISTDSLARHPGRPWPAIPGPVEEYYKSLSPETIHWFLRVHHQNIWPLIQSLLDKRAGTGELTVFEGAALRPEYISPLIGRSVAGIFLHAENELLLKRMRREAAYDDGNADRRQLIDAFIERSLRENTEMFAAAREHGLRVVDATDPEAIADFISEVTARAETSLT